MRILKITAVSAVSLAAAGGVNAQPQGQGAGWQSFVSASPVFEEGDLSAGGKMRISGIILRGGTSTAFGDGHRAGIVLNYDYFDYSFSDARAFGNIGPWGVVTRYGFSAPLSFAVADGWSVGVSPSVDWFVEDGASSSDARVWGATTTVVRRFDNGNFLGLGLATFKGIEENTVFPFPIFGWQLAPQWRLINPLPAGPTGPAGVELDYAPGGAWTFGAGLAYRTSRFRLSETGPVRNGVGEISGLPVFLRARVSLGPVGAVNFYAGVVTNGEVKVEDAAGNVLRKDDIDTTPIVGANVTIRF